MSPYNGYDGNPVFWADPSGADAITIVNDGNGVFRMTNFKTDEEFLSEMGISEDDYMSEGNDDGSGLDNGDPPRASTEVKPPPNAGNLDPKYNTNGKDWEIKGERATITTKKEILQWDSKKGEIEVYNKANKKHMGGYDAANRGRKISKPGNRTPNGGWNVNTSKMLKILKYAPKAHPALRILDAIIGPFIPLELQFNPKYNNHQIMM